MLKAVVAFSCSVSDGGNQEKQEMIEAARETGSKENSLNQAVILLDLALSGKMGNAH